jgi:glycosyltransferase involved in cell wall biosynthesis
MNITDINVNCSIGTETSCLALSEGMSLGIPAIASDYSGNKYIVKNKVNGLIFSQKDHIALAKSILLLVNDKKLYSYLSQNAKNRFINELNAERMTLETERYYLSMLKKKKLSIYLNKRS